MRRIALVSLILALSGCEGGGLLGYSLTLLASDGAKGTGYATGMGSGPIEVTLTGKVFKGKWVAAQGGSMGTGVVGTTAFSVISADTDTSGNAMLTATDGSTLLCRFAYGSLSAAGYGQCRDNTGKVYELQIS